MKYAIDLIDLVQFGESATNKHANIASEYSESRIDLTTQMIRLLLESMLAGYLSVAERQLSVAEGQLSVAEYQVVVFHINDDGPFFRYLLREDILRKLVEDKAVYGSFNRSCAEFGVKTFISQE